MSSRILPFSNAIVFFFHPQEKTKFWVKLSGDEISVSSDKQNDNDAKGKASSIAVASATTAVALLASALPQFV